MSSSGKKQLCTSTGLAFSLSFFAIVLLTSYKISSFFLDFLSILGIYIYIYLFDFLFGGGIAPYTCGLMLPGPRQRELHCRSNSLGGTCRLAKFFEEYSTFKRFWR